MRRLFAAPGVLAVLPDVVRRSARRALLPGILYSHLTTGHHICPSFRQSFPGPPKAFTLRRTRALIDASFLRYIRYISINSLKTNFFQTHRPPLFREAACFQLLYFILLFAANASLSLTTICFSNELWKVEDKRHFLKRARIDRVMRVDGTGVGAALSSFQNPFALFKGTLLFYTPIIAYCFYFVKHLLLSLFSLLQVV